jgi:hypothetical protein
MNTGFVVNIPPYEGEYEFDMNAQLMSPLEWEWVTKISGYLPHGESDFMKGIEGLDPKLFVAMAYVAMVRSGKVDESDVYDVALNLKRHPWDGVGITFKAGDDEEADDVDPPSESETEGSPPDSGSDSSGDTDASPESSEQSTSGTPDSPTGSVAFLPESRLG